MHNIIILQDAQRICERLKMDALRNTTILVTGASGLIGTYVLACLSHLKNIGFRMQVHGLCLSEPPPHVSELMAKDGFALMRIDLSDFNEYHKLPQADIIIHAAGYAQPSLFMANPIPTIQINTSATAALLKKLQPCGRFLFISSSEIYSGLKKRVLSENDVGLTSPSHPRAPYIEGKRCGEAICNAFLSQGIRVRIARVALAYGPGTRSHDSRALNAFIEKALLQDKIELLDTGSAVRTYCYVADIVELLWHILLIGKDTIYNVGGTSTITIAELAQKIGKLTGKSVTFPDTCCPSAGAPPVVKLDLSKSQVEFGKTEYVELEEGLKRTISWQRELYKKQLNSR
jgi:UDP-glucuronate decarboxylase